MEYTVEGLRRMGEETRWVELCAVLPSQIDRFEGQQRAQLYGIWASAAFFTAKEQEDLEQVLQHILQCQREADPTSNLAVWTLQSLAGIYVNLAQYEQAAEYGNQFLDKAQNNPALAPYVPLAERDISHACYHSGDYEKAIFLREAALAKFDALGQTDDVVRTACNLVWALARDGRLEEAEQMLPTDVPEHLEALRLGAACGLYFFLGRYAEAKQAGEAALARVRTLHDSLDASEVALVLADIADLEGEAEIAQGWRQEAIVYAAKQGVQLHLKVSGCTEAERRGHQNETVSRPTGERCGASFTTGVA